MAERPPGIVLGSSNRAKPKPRQAKGRSGAGGGAGGLSRTPRRARGHARSRPAAGVGRGAPGGGAACPARLLQPSGVVGGRSGERARAPGRAAARRWLVRCRRRGPAPAGDGRGARVRPAARLGGRVGGRSGRCGHPGGGHGPVARRRHGDVGRGRHDRRRHRRGAAPQRPLAARGAGGAECRGVGGRLPSRSLVSWAARVGKGGLRARGAPVGCPRRAGGRGGWG